jgi:FtsH-binding integral membrane protein
MYLVYDTQLIAGGSHRKHQFNIDDYAMAAICLCIDIIQLFLYLLSLMGNRR